MYCFLIFNCFLYSLLQELYELGYENCGTVANRVRRYEPGDRAVMNSAVTKSGKHFLMAAGMDDECHLYTLSLRVTSAKHQEGTHIKSTSNCTFYS